MPRIDGEVEKLPVVKTGVTVRPPFKDLKLPWLLSKAAK